jgi:hypothetical protein
MTHVEFVTAYREGRVRVGIDRKAAARFVSARVLLPLVLLPVLGLGVALALAGHFIIGVIVFLLGIGLRYAVRATSRGFVLQHALGNPDFYRDALASGAMRLIEADATQKEPQA